MRKHSNNLKGVVMKILTLSTVAFLAITGYMSEMNAMEVTVQSPQKSIQQSIGTQNYETESEPLLWDQPVSTSNDTVTTNQDFTDPDFDQYDTFLSDDFQINNRREWTMPHIYIPTGGWNPGESLLLAEKLHFMIYRDNGLGAPNGDPRGGGEPPVWTLSVLPSDSQISLSEGTTGQLTNITLRPTKPPQLQCGTYWLVAYPESFFSDTGQYGRNLSDTTNLSTALIMNPGEGFGISPIWSPITTELGYSQSDLAFSISGTETIPTPLLRSDFLKTTTNNIVWHNSATGSIDILNYECMRWGNIEVEVGTANLNLIPKGVGDFTNDGNVDILLHNQNSGNLRIWEMDGVTKVTSTQLLGSSNTNLKIAGVGDFDEDGDPDIATFNTNSGTLRIWVMNGTTRVNNIQVLTGANTNLVPRGVGDMDGDGIPDIVLRNNNSGAVRVWTMNSNFTRKGNEYVTSSSNTNLELRGVIDINGDGKNDILNFNTNSKVLRAWIMDNDMNILRNEILMSNGEDWSPRM